MPPFWHGKKEDKNLSEFSFPLCRRDAPFDAGFHFEREKYTASAAKRQAKAGAFKYPAANGRIFFRSAHKLTV